MLKATGIIAKCENSLSTPNKSAHHRVELKRRKSTRVPIANGDECATLERNIRRIITRRKQ